MLALIPCDQQQNRLTTRLPRFGDPLFDIGR
jgi:hypothetical protein